MTSYKIFLTKSHEAAVILASGLAAKKDNPKLCTGWGCTDGADFIPATYKDTTTSMRQRGLNQTRPRTNW